MMCSMTMIHILWTFDTIYEIDLWFGYDCWYFGYHNDYPIWLQNTQPDTFSGL